MPGFLTLLTNPWAILGMVLFLAFSHGAAYVKGRSDGGAHEIVKCEKRVTKLKNEIIAANEKIKEIGEQWKAAFDTVVDGNTALAKLNADDVDKLNKKVDDYEALISKDGTRANCVITDGDINSLQ
jgi:uncharacterized ubiquitin-like protein YukD